MLFGFAMPARMTLQPSGGFCFAQKRRLSSSSAMASLSALPEPLDTDEKPMKWFFGRCDCFVTKPVV